MAGIRLDRVSKIYTDSRRGRPATLEADLTIALGEFVFIAGHRGAGKSTLMELLAGELQPDRGSVWLGAANLTRMSRRESEDMRQCLGVVLQDSELRRTETVFKNLASDSLLEYFKNRLLDRPKIDKALALVGLPESGNRQASELTPAQSCRALLARAIWRSPPVLLLDGLLERADGDTAWDLLHLLTELNRRGTTVVVAGRGAEYGAMLHKRVVTLREGRIAEDTKSISAAAKERGMPR